MGKIISAVLVALFLVSITQPIQKTVEQGNHTTQYQKRQDTSVTSSTNVSERSVITQKVVLEKVTPTPTPIPTQAPVIQTAPVAAYEPPSTSVNSSVVVSYIQQVFGAYSGIAECIAYHESGYRTDAVNHNWNGTYDVGVFQINDVHGLSWDYRMNYIDNINYAYQLSDGGLNWGAWTTLKYCL